MAQRESNARFVDDAEYPDGHKCTAEVIDTDSKTRIACSVCSKHLELAEEVAIALALTDQECEVAPCDSQTAVKNYARGRFSKEALALLAKTGRPQSASWTIVEGDALPNLNETAHPTARYMIRRA
ncbi:hypothetical protein HPB52_011374 [Rhipicephalus sanguineus]|uniref:Uncharacterized protein n=1 Tax=Rhipicephalus sanguineus TaxID=34632 RepID=A0A9D4YPB2_RHISA|nr:hypothetical protein HPB52_011374 [Rhipicephalus sanguineus]